MGSGEPVWFRVFLLVSFVSWFSWSWAVSLVLVIARIYPRSLSVTTGAKTGHGVEDWVLGDACLSFFFLVYSYSLSNQFFNTLRSSFFRTRKNILSDRMPTWLAGSGYM